MNASDAREFARGVRCCDMDRIYQLRTSIVLADPGGTARRIVNRACRPMPEAVRRAFFFFHYTEMRGEHRGCDSPITRGQPVPLLLFLGHTLEHALRAALVLDGQPYPYNKWLHSAAAQSETGRLVAAEVDRIVELLGQGQLRMLESKSTHPITCALTAIRGILIERARAEGIDEPWLERWWLYVSQAREAIHHVRW